MSLAQKVFAVAFEAGMPAIKRVTSQAMSHGTHVNEEQHTRETVTAHTRLSQVRTWTSHIAHVNEICFTNE